MSVYEDKVESVRPVVERWLRRRRPDAPEEAVREFAKLLSWMLVLGAEWGAGDAYAGWLLQSIKISTIRRVKEVLERLGVRDLPRHATPEYFCMMLLDADWGDEEMNKLVKELDKFSASGGRYTPEAWRGEKGE